MCVKLEGATFDSTTDLSLTVNSQAIFPIIIEDGALCGNVTLLSGDTSIVGSGTVAATAVLQGVPFASESFDLGTPSSSSPPYMLMIIPAALLLVVLGITIPIACMLCCGACCCAGATTLAISVLKVRRGPGMKETVMNPLYYAGNAV